MYLNDYKIWNCLFSVNIHDSIFLLKKVKILNVFKLSVMINVQSLKKLFLQKIMFKYKLNPKMTKWIVQLVLA
jgi:hypothetical protein